MEEPKEEPEFEIGDIVTLDRYNHIDDVERVMVTGYGTMIGPDSSLTYKMDVRGTTIQSTGGSIMESKNYDPAPDEDRHPKRGINIPKISWEEYQKNN